MPVGDMPTIVTWNLNNFYNILVKKGDIFMNLEKLQWKQESTLFISVLFWIMCTGTEFHGQHWHPLWVSQCRPIPAWSECMKYMTENSNFCIKFLIGCTHTLIVMHICA